MRTDMVERIFGWIMAGILILIGVGSVIIAFATAYELNRIAATWY